MNNIIVTSRKYISDMASHCPDNHIIISITENTMQFADIDSNDKCLGILRLKFGDIDTKEFADAMNATLFSEEQARHILGFVKAHYDDIETIIINCDAGISRSAGVALALHRIYNIRPNDISSNPRFHPNFHVVNTLQRAFFKTTMESTHP